jgi:hypothetical protein
MVLVYLMLSSYHYHCFILDTDIFFVTGLTGQLVENTTSYLIM